MSKRIKYASIALALSLILSLVAHAATSEETGPASIPGDKEVVILLHGLGRSANAMWLLASRLEDAGFYVLSIGYSSLTQSPTEILADISQQIQNCCAAPVVKMHFVGHSFGGLLIRAYLEDSHLENLGRVVLLGTPNQGSEIVDVYRDRWWMKLAGPSALSLGTDDDSFPNSLKDPYYPVGVIAGARNGDGGPSAIIPGKDDGLVSVESTKLDGMTDFIVVQMGHASMRYSSQVAEQTIAFLKNGRFVRH